MAKTERITKKRLGMLLMEEGLVSREQIEEALEEQKITREPIGEILVRKSYVTELDVAHAISEQFSIPFMSKFDSDITEELASMFSLDVLRKHQFVPVDKFGSLLTVVIAGVLDELVLMDIEQSCKCKVQVYVGIASDVRRALDNMEMKQRSIALKRKDAEVTQKTEKDTTAIELDTAPEEEVLFGSAVQKEESPPEHDTEIIEVPTEKETEVKEKEQMDEQKEPVEHVPAESIPEPFPEPPPPEKVSAEEPAGAKRMNPLLSAYKKLVGGPSPSKEEAARMAQKEQELQEELETDKEAVEEYKQEAAKERAELEKQAAQIKDELEQQERAAEESQTAGKEHQALVIRVQELEAAVKEQRSTASKMQEEVEKERAELEQRVEGLKEDLAGFRQLVEEGKKASEDRQETEERYKALQAELQQQKDVMSQAKKEKQTVNASLQQEIRKLEDEVSQYEAASAETEALRNKSSELKKKESGLESEIDEQKALEAATRKEIGGLQDGHEKQVKELKERIEECRRMSGEKDEIVGEQIKLNKKIMNLKSQLSKNRTKVVNAHGKLVKLRSELGREAEDLKDELSSLKHSAGIKEDLQDTVAHLKEREKELKIQIDNQRAQAAEATKQAKEIGESFKEQVDEIKEEISRYRSLAEGREEAQNVRNELRHKIEELELELGRHRLTAVETRQEIDKIRVAYEEVLKELHGELEDCQKLAEGKKDAQAGHDELRHRLTALKSEVDSERRAAEDAIDRAERTRVEFEKLVDVLRAKLDYFQRLVLEKEEAEHGQPEMTERIAELKDQMETHCADREKAEGEVAEGHEEYRAGIEFILVLHDRIGLAVESLDAYRRNIKERKRADQIKVELSQQVSEMESAISMRRGASETARREAARGRNDFEVRLDKLGSPKVEPVNFKDSMDEIERSHVELEKELAEWKRLKASRGKR